MFRASPAKPFYSTRAAVELYGAETITACLRLLEEKAHRHGGLDWLQIFCDPSKREDLWFIDDGDGGAITALLLSDY